MHGMTRIDHMYAWVTLDPEDNTEGVLGFQDPDGGWMPMVGADRERIMSLRPRAVAMAKLLTNPVELVCFSLRETIEKIEPGQVRVR